MSGARRSRCSAVRVLIADDHPIFRDGLATLLEPHPDIEVVGAGRRRRRGGRARGRAPPGRHRHGHPDAARQRDRGDPAGAGRTAGVGVLVFTMGEDDGTLLSAMRAGARGYLVKGAAQDEVVRAITAVAAGGVVFGASLAARIGELLSPSPARQATEFPMLTEREREVLDLIAAGRSNGQIAAELFLAPKTVRNNVSAILSKLQATDRAEIIIRARDAGMGQRD